MWNFYLIAYIILVIFIMISVSKSLFSSGRSVAGGLVFIGFILVFVFYGMRWFKENGDPKNAYTGSWPPIINTCPDYFVQLGSACIDPTGVSSAYGLTDSQVLDNTSIPTEKKFTSLYQPGMNKTQLNGLCTAAKNAGLTWEGITNGDSCTFSA